MTKRLAVFASYDKNGIVHDSVVTYLKKLRAVADAVVFVADNAADGEQRAKLDGLADIAVFAPHGEYDFGSYKRGIKLAREKGILDGCDELILCNDSCFAVGDMTAAFADMEREACDFWGLSENLDVERHLQSFFLVFKRAVFTSEPFGRFFDAVKREPDVLTVIRKYEIPLRKFFESAGFKGAALIKGAADGNPTMYPLRMLDQRSFLIKRKVFCEPFYSMDSVGKLCRTLERSYPETVRDICEYFGVKTLRPLCRRLFWQRTAVALRRFLCQKKRTKNGKIIIKFCKVPVFYRRKNDSVS